MRGSTSVVCVLLGWTLLAAPAFGHGVVGKRTFIEPFVTEDANPKNELVIGRPSEFKSREGHEFSLGFSLEKKLADSVSLALEGEYRDLSLKEEANQSGFDNLSIMLKYAPVQNPVHEFIFSFAFEVAPPTGDRGVGAAKNAVLAPLALLGKGFGDSPQPLALLRPFAVMGDAGFEFPVTRNASDNDVFAYDLLLTYSLSYLESQVWDLGIPPVLDDLNPVVEFNFETVLNGPDRQTAVRVTPGLVYLGRYVELGVAGQFPLNNAADTELDWGILGIIDVFYDDLFEALGKWQLL